ncbi:MAG: ATP-binding cassette domain-containing protein, partial [Ruthenibacterium sp.]
MASFVQFENVSKFYQMGETRIAAADSISFGIEQGEFCVIVGPSGAGKTTVLNMLGGMDTCD